ncbi:thermolabile L-asparaginase [Pochonia chlamydosporia 170]|uniref:Thermolabile L-asparaginase n=1 Tax=Pochonia chlamydosporia 170 TaxID=1380566 RepID=A0A179F3D0_METCM|nr:thermolabile L-asparaginase [Pochonia chlamydosporia 170]OAQ59924.1 thermolabile L-asparaginase [Pochonia chlamydosporia 170]
MTRPNLDDDYIVCDRNGIIENRHLIHAAVVDSNGKLLFSIGNPSRLTLIRSSVKPAQALAVAESGAFQKYGFEEKDIALCCASHSSEEGHISRARSMLAKSGCDESHLRCGGHPALTPQMNNAWIKSGFVATPVFSNCSGKHAAFLAAAKAIGRSTDGYHQLEHPIQQRVKEIVEDLTGLSPDEVKWGVDGCNMAAPAVPLQSLAVLNAEFANAADLVAQGGDVSPRRREMARIFNAMSSYPEMVGGEGRFCTLLMKAFNGHLIGKVGADACYGIGVRASHVPKRLGIDGPIGIAVKVEDGNMDVLYAAVAELLDRLDLGTKEMRSVLDGFHYKTILNTAGVVTGEYAFPFLLKMEV